MTNEPVLQIEGLTAGYNGREVLRGLDFALHRGEMLGIVGPNGSGKSTLLKAVSQVLPLSSGSVRVMGEGLERYRPADLAKALAVVPQEALLPEGFTGLEITLMGRTPYLKLLQAEGSTDVRIARQSMLKTDTLRLADRPVSELSGGERQRVVIARALTQQTPILLLDEPTIHLDIGHQVGLLDLVRDLVREQSLSVIAVVHDLTLAAQYCERLLLLNEGAIVSSGSPECVLQEESITSIYGVEVTIIPHPRTGRPVVLSVPGSGGG